MKSLFIFLLLSATAFAQGPASFAQVPYFDNAQIQHIDNLPASMKSAESGDAHAQYSLGCAYYVGKIKFGSGAAPADWLRDIPVDQSTTESLKWLQKAAEQGFAPAQTTLGSILAFWGGSSTPELFRKRMDAIRKLQQDHSVLGTQISEEQWRAMNAAQTSPEMVKEGSAWLEKAARNGYIPATRELAAVAASGLVSAPDGKKAIELYTQAAQSGDVPSMKALAVIYADGKLIPPDKAAAASWLRKAADAGDVNALATLATRSAKDNDSDAVELLRRAADAGDRQSQRKLANILATGDGVPRDQAAAEKYFVASVNGARYEMPWLGDLFAEGRLVVRDYKKAMAAYLDCNCGYGTYRAGWLYENGFGTTQDVQMAADLYRRALDQNDGHSAAALARLYASGRVAPGNLAHEVEQARLTAARIIVDNTMSGLVYTLLNQDDPIAADSELSSQLARESAAYDWPQSQARLSDHYAKGEFGFPRDPVRAYAWLKIAAEKDQRIAEQFAAFAPACSESVVKAADGLVARLHAIHEKTGGYYEFTSPYAGWSDAAIQDIQNRAAAFDQTAQYRMGGAYELGIGVPKDLVAALRFYGAAAQYGQGEVKYQAAEFYLAGGDDDTRLDRAHAWLRDASSNGLAIARKQLAQLYEGTHGQAPDPEQAYYWYLLSDPDDADVAVATKKLEKELAPEKVAAERVKAEQYAYALQK